MVVEDVPGSYLGEPRVNDGGGRIGEKLTTNTRNRRADHRGYAYAKGLGNLLSRVKLGGR